MEQYKWMTEIIKPKKFGKKFKTILPSQISLKTLNYFKKEEEQNNQRFIILESSDLKIQENQEAGRSLFLNWKPFYKHR